MSSGLDPLSADALLLPTLAPLRCMSVKALCSALSVAFAGRSTLSSLSVDTLAQSVLYMHLIATVDLCRWKRHIVSDHSRQVTNIAFDARSGEPLLSMSRQVSRNDISQQQWHALDISVHAADLSKAAL